MSTPYTDRIEAEVCKNKEEIGESHQRALCEGQSKCWDLSTVTKFWRDCHAHKHALLASKIRGKHWTSTCINLLVIQCLSALDSVDPEERRYPRPVGAMMRFRSGVIASTPQDNRAMRIRRGYYSFQPPVRCHHHVALRYGAAAEDTSSINPSAPIVPSHQHC